ncbi:RNA polymerase subunit sigma-24 [Sphingomonas panacis]|uniref:RNA polymerase subunit sigma-24 n=1 Tax=Sphingomonas panacis TaxID=1560345 RepID=A0A1B3ZEY8_9SPHN|nr:sigma-70 family RNA polymerase sigma factor [Sphingomonas panacis]AOH85992.1 RNA polymerase subunit sigma-24 [Sphingomonas panacis]
MPTNAIALTRLLLTERPSLLRLAQRIVGLPAAEDVTQSLWLRVQRVEDDPPILNKRAYLYRLAGNLATDYARGTRRHDQLFEAADPPTDAPSNEPSAESRVIDRERLARLEAVLEELPLRCRQVFVLRRIDGLPAHEVAARLGITVNAVAKHVRIAVRHCHARMTDEPDA